jgi:hypothetical protein
MFHAVCDRRFTDFAADMPGLRPPGAIQFDTIGDARRAGIGLEHGRAAQRISVIRFKKEGCVMSRRVETLPERMRDGMCGKRHMQGKKAASFSFRTLSSVNLLVSKAH